MAKKNVLDEVFTEHELHGLSTSIEYILAGLKGGIAEYALVGLSLQLVSDGSFRCILRGYRRTGEDAGVGLVSFTNSEDAAICLLHAENGFRRNVIRWHVDQFAGSVSDNGASKDSPEQLTLL